MEKISDNIYVETGFLGCNPSFVITSIGIVMIDVPQKPTEALKWRNEILKFGDIAYIINTDHHQDHALGNYYFEGNLIMHEGTMRKLFSEDRREMFKDWVKRIEFQSGHLMEHFCIRKPKFTYGNRMNIYLGEETFELIHVTSHTEDETIVYMPQKKVVFVGDTVCTNGIPSLQESYLGEWLETLDFLRELDFEVLVPGHGSVGDKDSVNQFQKELTILISRVGEKIRNGFNKEEIVKEINYEDKVHIKYPHETSEFFNQAMKRSIGRIYDELTKDGSKLLNAPELSP